MIKVFITDDHQLVLDGINSILHDNEDISVVGSALGGEQTLEFLEQSEVDVLLLDINMPDMDGIEVARIVKEKGYKTKVLMLTMHNNPQFTKELIELGILGCVLKNSGKREVIDAIKKVNAGDRFYAADVTGVLFDSIDKSKKAAQKVELTKREIEVLKLIANEYTTNEIAEELFISSHTVETHRKNLLSKLMVKNTAGLVRFAVKNGLDI